jgi:hypothetical protein
MVRYVICINNEGYLASLEARKVYQVLPDPAHGYLRVIDESEEDYLFAADRFVPIEVPVEVQQLFAVEAA